MHEQHLLSGDLHGTGVFPRLSLGVLRRDTRNSDLSSCSCDCVLEGGSDHDNRNYGRLDVPFLPRSGVMAAKQGLRLIIRDLQLWPTGIRLRCQGSM